jgi:hypothetical protein
MEQTKAEAKAAEQAKREAQKVKAEKQNQAINESKQK